jgi:CpeT/CpcT family (DUF1001)
MIYSRPEIALLISSLWAIALPGDAQITLEQDVKAVVKHLVGVMDTGNQAAANPHKPHVRMTTCPIAVTGLTTPSGAVYLYQEQALADKLAEPYRQRVLEISASPYSQSVRSLTFKLTQPQSVIGFCNQPLTQRTLRAETLVAGGCAVFLRRSGENYAGSTPIDGCPANVRGAVRLTNRVLLHADGMDTWDRGFDAKGKQIWGAKTESYQYRWVKPN